MNSIPPGKVMVTGATGFIGRRLVALLEAAGAEVIRFAASTGQQLNDAGCFAPFLGEGITHVIHLAGKTFVPDSWEEPGLFYRTNALGTQQALDFCRATGASLVYVSAYVYGIPQLLPIPESHPVAPNNPYAHSKWLGEEFCRFYAQQFGVPVTVLRPFNIFGAGQGAQFLIPSLLRQARTETVLTVKDVSPKRDYLHVDDFARACIGALQARGGYSLFNVGSGHSVSVAELLDMVVKHSPRAVTWRSSGETRVNEIPDTVADISAIRRALQWSPEITLEEFIRSELS